MRLKKENIIIKHIIENKSKEYILELIKNKETQEQELDTLYDENTNNIQIKIM